MEATPTAKILLFNIGYCTGLDGSRRDYFLHFLRYLHTPRKVWKGVVRGIDRLIEAEKPDICCFLEFKRAGAFLERLPWYPFFDFENKYGVRSILRHAPFFRRNLSGFFARKKVDYLKHEFRYGVKKLIYEIRLRDDLSVLVGHFSLRAKTRRKQFQEMRDLIRQRERVILCGDFNVFRGRRELDELLSECNLRVINADCDRTFPAVHPKRSLDLFLCSKDVHILSLKVANGTHASDHLPVILEVDLSE